MKCKVIDWDLNVSPRKQLIQLVEGQVEIESRWVIKVVVRCVIVLVWPIQRDQSVNRL